jgi:hypothetical protein
MMHQEIKDLRLAVASATSKLAEAERKSAEPWDHPRFAKLEDMITTLLGRVDPSLVSARAWSRGPPGSLVEARANQVKRSR